jgi:hypothetical protein
MKDIFISFSSKDRDFVESVCKELKKSGLEYWVSFENELFGISYAEAIINAIKECKVFLVFISKNSSISTHVINEINSAVMRDKLILPVKIDDLELSGIMEYYLASNHWIEHVNDKFDETCDKIIRRLMSIFKPSSNPDKISLKTAGNSGDIISKAEKGDANAQFKIGRCYYKGIEGFQQNIEESIKWYTLAAKNNHADAQCNLAWCYEVGDGVEQDFEKAYFWYLEAAKNNCAMAQYSLGWMFENGIFVSKNMSKAFDWYCKAAENNHEIAQYKIGLAYSDGVLVEQSDVIANHWFAMAADRNNVMAQYKLAEQFYFGKGCKKDIIKAKNMWLLSAEKGYIKSYEALEKYYDIFYNSDKKTFDI